MGTGINTESGPITPRQRELWDIENLVAVYVEAKYLELNAEWQISWGPANTPEAVTRHLTNNPTSGLDTILKSMKLYETAILDRDRARTIVSAASTRLAAYGIALDYVVSDAGVHLQGTLTTDGATVPLMFDSAGTYTISNRRHPIFGDGNQICRAAAKAVANAYEAIKYPPPSAAPSGPPRRVEVTGMATQIGGPQSIVIN